MSTTRLACLGLVTLLTAACGGDDGGADAAIPDAAIPDAAIPDAAVPDAALPGPVSLTMYGDGHPVADVDVVFGSADGTVVTHVQTGADGRASADLLAGGSVTALLHAGDQFTAITWADVEPGDQLVWGTPEVAGSVGMVQVSLPGVLAGASRYEVRLGCLTMETTDPTVAVSDLLTQKCLGSDQNIDVVALGFAANGALVGYSTDTEVPAVAGGLTAVTLDAWTTAVDPLTMTLHGAPAAAAKADLQVHFRIDGLDFGGPTASATFSGGTATLDSLYLKGNVADKLQYLVFVTLGTPEAPEGVGVIVGGHAATPATVDYDLATTLLPSITAASAGAAGTRVHIDWSAAGSLAATDGAILLARWSDGATSHQWFALVPPGVTSPYRLPALPDELAAFRPTVASAFTTPAVIFIESAYVPDWHAMRTEYGFRFVGETAFDTLPAAGGVARAIIGGQMP